MKSVRVTFQNGDIIHTGINGTNQEIQKYYEVGKFFNLGNRAGGNNMQKVIKCELLQNFFFKFTGREVGSVGETYEIEREIKAYTEPEAIFELYETYERIQGLTIDRNKHEQEETSEPTFGAHVNSVGERIIHRSHRRLALIESLETSTEMLKFLKYTQNNRRDLTKPRKIR